LLVAKRTEALDGGVGESGDLAGHRLFFAEALLDQRREFLQRLFGALAGHMDDDRIAHRRAEHHQPHDRGAAHFVTVLLDLDRRVDLAGQVDEFGARPGVKPAELTLFNLAADRAAQAAASPRISEATEIYLRPASRAAATAAWTGITLRAPSNHISIRKVSP